MSEIKAKKEPKQARSKETVEAILQSVVALVDQRDTGSVTTTQIAERAGISIGSLYQYFPGKDAVFSALIEWYLRKEAGLILAGLTAQDGKPLNQAVDEMLTAIIAIRKKNLKLERVLLGYFTRSGNFEFLKRYDEQMTGDLDKVLRAAEARGFLQREENTAFLLLHVIRSTFLATTLERPTLYEQSEELHLSLKKMVLALIAPAH